MSLKRTLSIVVVSLASVIVLAVVIGAAIFFLQSRGDNQQNFSPPEGQQTRSSVADAVLISRNRGSSSFLYRKNARGLEVRLTTAPTGIESEPSFSHDGKLVVYSFAATQDSKSAVWVIGTDGSNPHAVTRSDEDALHPAFSPDDSKVFYAASSFTGHHSPIARPARHEWDVFSVPVQPSGTIAGVAPARITYASFYDLQSLDVSADSVDPQGVKLLISTSGYPIGALIEEFPVGASGRNKIFQPHVPGESSPGPSYGEARFIHGGMDILFLAATDKAGANYDYNVYSMSDVTGGELKQLTHLKGMTRELRVLPNGKATFINSGVEQGLDVNTQTVSPL